MGTRARRGDGGRVFGGVCARRRRARPPRRCDRLTSSGTIGPGQQAILLPGLTRDAAAALARAFAGSDTVRTGVASYPADGSSAAALLARAAARARGEERATGDAPDGGMRRVEALAARAAGTDIPVLILGETGVGKEVLARTIHGCVAARRSAAGGHQLRRAVRDAAGERAVRPRAGAFTGAAAAKPGLLETAPGGTVLLDEIGELPLPLQAKLLRVIEAREVMRVGGVRAAADRRALHRRHQPRPARPRSARGAFRARSLLPPERHHADRPAAARAARRDRARWRARSPPSRRAPWGARRPSFRRRAWTLLAAHGWPGNIRELRNVVERAVLLCDGTILREHLPERSARGGRRRRRRRRRTRRRARAHPRGAGRLRRQPEPRRAPARHLAQGVDRAARQLRRRAAAQGRARRAGRLMADDSDARHHAAERRRPDGRRRRAVAPPVDANARYALDREIARGGMGRVFAGRDLRLQRDGRDQGAAARRTAALARASSARRSSPRGCSTRPSCRVHDAGLWPSGEPFLRR